MDFLNLQLLPGLLALLLIPVSFCQQAPVNCTEVVTQACQGEYTDAYTKAYALHEKTHGVVTSNELANTTNAQAAATYCGAVNKLEICYENTANDRCRGTTNTLTQMLSDLRQSLVLMFGDPRAFLAKSGRECQQMVDMFFNKSLENYSDPTQGLLCVTTCARKYNSNEPGAEFRIIGLCKEHPDLNDCMRSCGASDILIYQCGLDPSIIPNESNRLSTTKDPQYNARLECGQQCMFKYVDPAGGQSINFNGICRQHPDIEVCMRNCQTDPAFIAQCILPESCVQKGQLTPPQDSNIANQCSYLPVLLECQMPVMLAAQNEAMQSMKMILLSIQSIPNFDQQASEECKTQLKNAMAEVDAAIAGKAAVVTQPSVVIGAETTSYSHSTTNLFQANTTSTTISSTTSGNQQQPAIAAVHVGVGGANAVQTTRNNAPGNPEPPADGGANGRMHASLIGSMIPFLIGLFML